MCRLLRSGLILAWALMFFTEAIAENDNDVSFKIKPSGFAFFQMGQVVNGGFDKRKGIPLDKLWFQNLVGGFSLTASLSPKDIFTLAAEINLFNDFPRKDVPQKSRELGMYIYLAQAEYSRSFGPLKSPFIKMKAGYFPFKYNKDVRNLGEYLFRTGTYPQYIANAFDFPLARLLGLNISMTAIKNFTLDLLLFSNIEWYAVNDWNLGAIATYDFFGFAELGAGVTFNSVFWLDEEQTFPKNTATEYVKDGYKYNYTFRGSKVMARLSLDPKRLFQSEIFGIEDLILYGEAAILGLKNYPKALNNTIDYSDITERIPVMAGFNIPPPLSVIFDNIFDFRLLDVLSVEVEWFGCRYPNDMRNIVFNGIPIPGETDAPKDYRAMKEYWEDNWKWSVYAKKTIGKHGTIVAQVASDHLRSLSRDFYQQDWEEVLRKWDEWYYELKFQIAF